MYPLFLASCLLGYFMKMLILLALGSALLASGQNEAMGTEKCLMR